MKRPFISKCERKPIYHKGKKTDQFYYIKTCKSILQKEPKSIEEMVKMFNLHYRKVAYFL